MIEASPQTLSENCNDGGSWLDRVVLTDEQLAAGRGPIARIPRRFVIVQDGENYEWIDLDGKEPKTFWRGTISSVVKNGMST